MESDKGFTLIELLVTMAVIAVLVAIVIVAINPAQRVRDALDRTAASNVRSTGTLISLCVTKRLSETPALPFEPCSQGLVINDYGNKPNGVTLAASADPMEDDVCAAQQGSPNPPGFAHYYVYKYTTGQVEPLNGILPGAGVWCP